MGEIKLSGFNVVEHKTEDAYLLVLESAASKAGLLSLAGGGFDENKDKTPQHGAGREGNEETNLTVDPGGAIAEYYYPNGSGHRLHKVFASHYDGELAASEEHRLVGFFPFRFIEQLEEEEILRGPAVIDSIKRYRAGQISPADLPFIRFEGLRGPREDYERDIPRIAAMAVEVSVFHQPRPSAEPAQAEVAVAA